MIQIVQGNITEIKVDAIVNAANSSLLGGGGVDGAIHRAGGGEILEECRMIRARQGSLPPGNAVMTTAGKLPAKHVIHAVGPVWNGGKNNEDETLANAYLNSLIIAEEKALSSIAFPNISTGIYGFPKERAAQIAISTVKDFLRKSNNIKEVYFVCFDSDNYEIYQKIMSE